MKIADEIIPFCQLLVLLVAAMVACGFMGALTPLVLFMVLANLLLAIYQQVQHPKDDVVPYSEWLAKIQVVALPN